MWQRLGWARVWGAAVLASSLSYSVVRPEGRRNVGGLIEPQRPLPATMAATDLSGQPFDLSALKGQWLLVSVAGGACDAGCEKRLWLQRQLREALGREKDRVDKVWLVDDAQALRPETLQAVSQGDPVTVLRVPREALAQWLAPAAGPPLLPHHEPTAPY